MKPAIQAVKPWFLPEGSRMALVTAAVAAMLAGCGDGITDTSYPGAVPTAPDARNSAAGPAAARQAAPKAVSYSWERVGVEGEWLDLPVGTVVRYGAESVGYVTRTLAGGLFRIRDSYFGHATQDVQGVLERQIETITPDLEPTPTIAWERVGVEGEWLDLPAGMVVRYGAESVGYVTRTLAGGLFRIRDSYFGHATQDVQGVLERQIEVMPTDFDSDASMQRIAGLSNSLTPAYSAAGQTASFCQTGMYPARWTWAADSIASQPQPATAADGTPRIEQYRDGKLIATYDKLGGAGCMSAGGTVDNPDTSCGALHRTPHRNWRDGDLFLVYPAVYEGPNHHPWIGPMIDDYAGYLAGAYHMPRNITIRGVTVNGKRPVIKTGAESSYNTLNQSLVYIDASEGITFENFDIDGGGSAATLGKAGLYISGAKNLTVRDVRIYGFKDAHANGIFGTDTNSGTLRLDRVELRGNGGAGGPEHNLYFNKSRVDPQFTVWMTNSWSHGAFYGHLFKSRAQVNILEGNYFQGTPATLGSQSEAFLVDFPSGGRVFMRNNVLAKTYSGNNSNGIFVGYGMEGIWDARPLSIRMEHNTFVSFSRFYDDHFHEMIPMSFFYPGLIPGSANFPVPKVAIRNNVFAGFCASGYAPANYRGHNAYIVGVEDLTQDFSLRTRRASDDSSVLGTRSYSHLTQNRARQAATVGARD